MKTVTGVDEVGRGPLAGPVVACAVILPKDHMIEGLNDSKKLSKKKRAKLFSIIQKESTGIGIGIIGRRVIDKINIREPQEIYYEIYKIFNLHVAKINNVFS